MCQTKSFENNFNFRIIACRFKAATPENLWNAFENVLYEEEFDLGTDVTVTEYMRSWTEQPGYPLVEIARDNDTFVITQVVANNIENVSNNIEKINEP